MPRLSVFYQYLYPDENVSSRHLSELCAGMAERGWEVKAHPSNRNLDNPQTQYRREESWCGVTLQRIWRPRISRTSTAGRILNAAWMASSWSLLALKRRSAPDVLIVGTDPILSLLVAPVWRFLQPKTRIVHWCFDLYPEAAYAEGLIQRGTVFANILERLLASSYRACDLVADIGPCMRECIAKNGAIWQSSTLVPWALVEPCCVPQSGGCERELIFGSAQVALMYSGTFGRAHSYEDLLALMADLHGDSVHLAFSVKGQRAEALRSAAAGRANVSFVPFAPTERLEERLASADIHVVTLRDEWTGMVIPSKFFGALAAGRPVLFCGSAQCALARWIKEYRLGWVLEAGGSAQAAAELRRLQRHPEEMLALRLRCFNTYHHKFSKWATLTEWHTQLSGLLNNDKVASTVSPRVNRMANA